MTNTAQNSQDKEITRIGENGYSCLSSELHRIHQHYDFVGMVEDHGDQMAEFKLVTEIDEA